MKNSGDFTSQKRELSEKDRRQAFIDTNQPFIDEALKSMEKSLRADARADKYDLFRSHLQKLGLSKRSPKLMLDVTIEFVEASLLYIPSNQREIKRILHLLSLQRYNLCEVPDARYVFTFNIFGKTCGRVVLDQKTDYLGPDLYDLFGCSWEKCNKVGYSSLFISHPDWSRITNLEFKRLEQNVAFDLHFDGDEDIRFSFRRASDNSLLKVTVWDI